MAVIARTSAIALLLFDVGAGLVNPMGWAHLAIGIIALPAALAGTHEQGKHGLPHPKDVVVTPSLTLVVLRERRQTRREVKRQSKQG